MKKAICLVFSAVLFVFLAAAPVSAESTIEAVELPLPEYIGELPSVVPLGLSRNFTCNPGSYSDPLVVDYYVTQGTTKLIVESCTWNPPACDIVVGFYPCVATNPGPFGVRFSGGSIGERETIRTTNIPTGMYWVYVYNAGYTSVSGTINYSISG